MVSNVASFRAAQLVIAQEFRSHNPQVGLNVLTASCTVGFALSRNTFSIAPRVNCCFRSQSSHLMQVCESAPPILDGGATMLWNL